MNKGRAKLFARMVNINLDKLYEERAHHSRLIDEQLQAQLPPKPKPPEPRMKWKRRKK